jgi:hypothetical protein
MYRHSSNIVNDEAVFVTASHPAFDVSDVFLTLNYIRQRVFPSLCEVLEVDYADAGRYIISRLNQGPAKVPDTLSASQLAVLEDYLKFFETITSQNNRAIRSGRMSFSCSNSRSGNALVWVHLAS